MHYWGWTSRGSQRIENGQGRRVKRAVLPTTPDGLATRSAVCGWRSKRAIRLRGSWTCSGSGAKVHVVHPVRVKCKNAAARPLQAWCERVARWRGKKTALVALARKLLTIAFHLLQEGTTIDPQRLRSPA